VPEQIEVLFHADDFTAKLFILEKSSEQIGAWLAIIITGFVILAPDNNT
jgi:hypothetical protein